MNTPHFAGETYEPELDEKRLTTQLARVKEYMLTGYWTTLAEMATYAGGSEAGCSARLRDLRKQQNGGFIIERRRRGHGGLHEYRLRLPEPTGQKRLF